MKSVLLNYVRKTKEKHYFDNVIYDRDRNVSIYQDGNQFIPIIDVPTVNMGVMTKTEAAREKDDTFPINLAIETKTLSQRESDDQGPYNY